MNFINLDSTGWIDIPADPQERIIEAEGAEVLIRRTADDPESGPRAILKPGVAQKLPANIAYSAKLNAPRPGAGLRVFAALALKTSRQGPGFDMFPITPDDETDLPAPADALYIGTAGEITVITLAGETRTIPVYDYSLLPVGVSRVLETGTTAEQIFGIV